MHAIYAPHPYSSYQPDEHMVFLAGGITDCPDWQAEALRLMGIMPVVVLNPRRTDVFKPEDAEAQIEWEYNALRACPTIIFWFPEETLCPITLFELGAFSRDTGINLIVGTHPNYARRFDVVKQLSLVRPGFVVHDNLENVIQEYKELIDYPHVEASPIM